MLSVPASATDFREGDDAIELAEMAGLTLDPWQRFALRQMLARRADGAWAAFEAALVVPRQNGKTVVLAAYELAALFLHREKLVIHSAHQYDTSMEAMRFLLELVEGSPELSRQVKARGVSRSHGAEGIELTGNRRIRFRTRTKGGGRGFSGGRLVFDEAMMFPASTHSALMYVVSAQPEKQLVYAGSAVDREVHEDGWVLAGLRERASAGDDPSLAYLEWSAGDDIDRAMQPQFAGDPENWAAANPALGVRPGITGDHIANEFRASMSNPRSFAVERLGVGDWPSTDEDPAEAAVPLEAWADCLDEESEPAGAPSFAFDVSPDRSSASIGVAAVRDDGLAHLEVIDRRPGTGWLVDRCVELADKHDVDEFLYDEAGPAAAVAKRLSAAGLRLRGLKSREYVQACGQFFDAVTDGTVRHRSDTDLDTAVRGATRRDLNDAFAWARRASTADITPLVACTLALTQVNVDSEPLIAWGR